MSGDPTTAPVNPTPRGTTKARTRTATFVAQVCFVLALLLVWLGFEGVRASKSLWVLFLYSFPSEFLIAAVPHEPVLLYFGKFYSPLTVALVSAAGTLLTEALNYSVFGYIADTQAIRRISRRGFVIRVVELFGRAPFAALWVAGFTPIPFYPFRFLVVLAHYPLRKYLLALLLSRTPRFWLYAYVGRAIGLSDELIVALFVVLVIVAIVNSTLIRNAVRRRHAKDPQTDPSSGPTAPEARDPEP